MQAVIVQKTNLPYFLSASDCRMVLVWPTIRTLQTNGSSLAFLHHGWAVELWSAVKQLQLVEFFLSHLCKTDSFCLLTHVFIRD